MSFIANEHARKLTALFEAKANQDLISLLENNAQSHVASWTTAAQAKERENAAKVSGRQLDGHSPADADPIAAVDSIASSLQPGSSQKPKTSERA